MDYLSTAGVSAGSVSVILIIFTIIKSICGKKLVSDCCQKSYEVGVGIRNLDSPPESFRTYQAPPEIGIEK